MEIPSTIKKLTNKWSAFFMHILRDKEPTEIASVLVGERSKVFDILNNPPLPTVFDSKNQAFTRSLVHGKDKSMIRISAVATLGLMILITGSVSAFGQSDSKSPKKPSQSHLKRDQQIANQKKARNHYPNFTLPSIEDQKPISLSDYHGKKILLVHFAAW